MRTTKVSFRRTRRSSIFVLYYWYLLCSSELMLRFPSIIAGTLTPWIAFLWLKRALGRASACKWLGPRVFTHSLESFRLDSDGLNSGRQDSGKINKGAGFFTPEIRR